MLADLCPLRSLARHDLGSLEEKHECAVEVSGMAEAIAGRHRISQ